MTKREIKEILLALKEVTDAYESILISDYATTNNPHPEEADTALIKAKEILKKYNAA